MVVEVVVVAAVGVDGGDSDSVSSCLWLVGCGGDGGCWCGWW